MHIASHGDNDFALTSHLKFICPQKIYSDGAPPSRRRTHTKDEVTLNYRTRTFNAYMWVYAIAPLKIPPTLTQVIHNPYLTRPLYSTTQRVHSSILLWTPQIKSIIYDFLIKKYGIVLIFFHFRHLAKTFFAGKVVEKEQQ